MCVWTFFFNPSPVFFFFPIKIYVKKPWDMDQKRKHKIEIHEAESVI